MPRMAIPLFMTALAVFIVVCIVFGRAAIVYPPILFGSFLVSFFLTSMNASIQSSSNPGLEKIDEPDYWWSSVYNAWLYVTDREGWAWYACAVSVLRATIVGSAIGAVILWKITSFTVGLMSWISGMFLMGSIAVLIATSEYWTKTEEYETSYEDIEPLLRARVKLR